MTMVEMVLYHSFHGLLVNFQILWPGIKLWCHLVSLWRLFEVISWQFSCIPSWTFRQKWARHNWRGREPKLFPFLARERDMQAAIAGGWIMPLLPSGVISRRGMGSCECEVVVLGSSPRLRSHPAKGHLPVVYLQWLLFFSHLCSFNYLQTPDKLIS